MRFVAVKIFFQKIGFHILKTRHTFKKKNRHTFKKKNRISYGEEGVMIEIAPPSPLHHPLITPSSRYEIRFFKCMFFFVCAILPGGTSFTI